MMRAILTKRYRDIHGGFSADRVVADPELNARFIEACRQAGLTESVRDLNVALLNLRKSGDLGSASKVRRTEFRDQEEYRHASEIAARHMELKHGVSWDVIVSTPELVADLTMRPLRSLPASMYYDTAGRSSASENSASLFRNSWRALSRR
jgi:hypothetical protein